ncbi:hypothetical protein Q9189_005919 [Teloschistes chrysophthalmus]
MYQDASLIRTIVLSLADKNREIIMLLHSYGGAPGSEAVKGLSKQDRENNGHLGGVVHIIYMCGFMLQVGECGGGASLPHPVPDPVGMDEATGTTFILEPRIPLFYADVEPGLAKEMDELLVSQSGSAMTDVVTWPAWQHIPTTYVRTLHDEVLFPDWQARQIKAVQGTGAALTIETLESSHSPFLSEAEEMVAVVKRVSGVED